VIPLFADVAAASEIAPPAPPAPASETATASAAPAPNALFFEALGNGLVYSLSYERFLSDWDRYPIGLRAGASFFTYKISDAAGSGNLTLATFPVIASYYLGPPRHKLQLGLGATILWISASSDSTGTKYEGSDTGLGIAATGVVGYRYLPPRGGLVFGAAFTPLLRASKGLLPWGGLSLGYSF
jgi:hypothetical protein